MPPRRRAPKKTSGAAASKAKGRRPKQETPPEPELSPLPSEMLLVGPPTGELSHSTSAFTDFETPRLASKSESELPQLSAQREPLEVAPASVPQHDTPTPTGSDMSQFPFSYPQTLQQDPLYASQNVWQSRQQPPVSPSIHSSALQLHHSTLAHQATFPAFPQPYMYTSTPYVAAPQYHHHTSPQDLLPQGPPQSQHQYLNVPFGVPAASYSRYPASLSRAHQTPLAAIPEQYANPFNHAAVAAAAAAAAAVAPASSSQPHSAPSASRYREFGAQVGSPQLAKSRLKLHSPDLAGPVLASPAIEDPRYISQGTFVQVPTPRFAYQCHSESCSPLSGSSTGQTEDVPGLSFTPTSTLGSVQVPVAPLATPVAANDNLPTIVAQPKLPLKGVSEQQHAGHSPHSQVPQSMGLHSNTDIGLGRQPLTPVEAQLGITAIDQMMPIIQVLHDRTSAGANLSPDEFDSAMGNIKAILDHLNSKVDCAPTQHFPQYQLP